MVLVQQSAKKHIHNLYFVIKQLQKILFLFLASFFQFSRVATLVSSVLYGAQLFISPNILYLFINKRVGTVHLALVL